MNPAISAWSCGFEHRHRPEQVREQPAAVDVADDDDRQIRRASQAHVHQVGCAQVDFGGRSGSLADDRVEFASQLCQFVLHDGGQPVAVRQYSAAVTVPATWPLITSCEVMSLPGLSRIGLNRTLGARPAARACIAWARPISPPSTVTAELFDMFCALNGATRIPLRANNRHSPATTIDLPASDVVPATSSAPLTAGRSRQGEDFRAGLGDQQGVLELRGPLAVLGDHGPAVVPDLVVQRRRG